MSKKGAGRPVDVRFAPTGAKRRPTARIANGRRISKAAAGSAGIRAYTNLCTCKSAKIKQRN